MSDPLSAFPLGSPATRLLLSLDRSRVVHRQVARGEAIFQQGDPVTAVFLLGSGRIRLARTLADGTSVILHVVEAGESFAEASLFAETYHCDALAETDSVVLSLPKRALLAALTADPVESLALAGALATQVRDLRARLELRNIRSAPARLLAWLRLRAAGNPPIVAIKRPWTLIANELGLTREAVYRALAQLEHESRIRRRDNTVRLLSPSDTDMAVRPKPPSQAGSPRPRSARQGAGSNGRSD